MSHIYNSTPIQNMRRKSELTPHLLKQESTNLDNFRKHEKGVNENVSGGFSRNEKVGRVWREVPASTLHTSHTQFSVHCLTLMHTPFVLVNYVVHQHTSH